MPAAHELTDLQFDNIATAQLAVYGEVEHGAVAYTPLPVEPETNGLNLLWFEEAFGAQLPTFVPRSAVLDVWVVL